MNQTTKLKPPWLYLARFAWVILTVTMLAVFIRGMAAQLRDPLPSCTTPGANCIYWTFSREDMQVIQEMGWDSKLAYGLQLGIVWVVKLIFFLLAVLIFWRRSDDWMAMLLSFMLLSFILEGVGTLGFDSSVGTILLLIGGVIFFIMPFLFPSGRFEPRWAVGLIVFFMALIFLQFVWFNALMVGVGIWFVFSAYAVVYRYLKSSTAVERQQIKWVMTGFLGWGIGFILQGAVGLFYPASQPSVQRIYMIFLYNLPLYVLSLLIIPVTLSIAVLRYRLWDIDIIIRKTLQYSALTAALALIYIGSVLFLQNLSVAVFGLQSPVIIVLSTLLIAALFNPLRKRIQQFIDQRFFRRKYDAEKTLEAFSQVARNETNMEILTTELLQAVGESIQPEKMSVWLKSVNKR